MCFGAGGSYSLVNYFGVSESLNYFLRNKNFITYGTMLSFGKSGFFTGRSYCRINHFCMTVCSHYFLFY